MKIPARFNALTFLMLLGVLLIMPRLMADEPEALALTVVLLDHSGQPAPGIELVAGHSKGDGEVAALGVTDANGQVVLSLSRPAEPTRLGVIISEGVAEGADWMSRLQAIRNLAQTNSWNAIEWFPLEANATEKTVTVTLRSAITVRGRVVNPPPTTGTAFVQQRLGPIPAMTKVLHGGAFELYAVARDQPTDVFVFSSDGCVSIVSLTAAQTALDVDLGDLDGSCGTKDAIVQLTFDGQNWPAPVSSSIVPGVTLILSNGTRILYFFALPNGNVVSDPSAPSALLPITSGTWYVVPGLFNPAQSLHLRAFDLVRSGQTALVPNWPTITVAPGETATATVHAADLDAAIRATMPPE